MDRVVWDSWHKFVYYDEIDKCKILDDLSKYNCELNSSEPIVIYIFDEGLPKINEDIYVDRYSVEFFHHRYYELLIKRLLIHNNVHEIS